MSWSCGIVGLPNAGKSTLFKALTAIDVPIDNYPFTTIDPNIAVVPLEDSRLESLAELCSSTKVTPPSIRIVDVAGLVKGASRGEGLGNRFLGELRNVDLLLHVIAGFEQFDGEDAGPASRASLVNLELILADLETIARRKEKIRTQQKSGSEDPPAELCFLDRLEEQLQQGVPARLFPLAGSEAEYLGRLFLITSKKMIYIYNRAEGEETVPESLFELARNQSGPLITLHARLEAEIGDLPVDEKRLFLQEYGFEESRIQELLRECHRLLDLITFYTVKGDESRAWFAPRGITAREAAFRVHTDIGRGFINAGVIPWNLLLGAGGLATAREQGVVRTEGRDYQVADGDVLYFNFREPAC